MKASETGIPNGLDRISGLMAWWGMPHVLEAGQIEAQAKKCQLLTVDLVKLFSAASANQAQVLSNTNERFARAFQDLLMAQQPPELMTAQSSLVTALVESLAAQTKIWAELTQNVYACCSTMICEAGVGAGEQAGGPKPVAKPAEAEPDQQPKPKDDRQPMYLGHAHG